MNDQFRRNVMLIRLTSLISIIINLNNKKRKELRFVFRKKKREAIIKTWNILIVEKIKEFVVTMDYFPGVTIDQSTGCVYKEVNQKYPQ